MPVSSSPARWDYFDAAASRWGKAEAAAIWAFTLENNYGIRNAIAREHIECSFQEAGQTICAASDEEWQRIQRSVRLVKELGMETQLPHSPGCRGRHWTRGIQGGTLSGR